MAFFGNGTVGSPTPVGDPSRTGRLDGFDAGGSTGAGRKNVNNAPFIGTAITREEYAKRQAAGPTPPPSVSEASSNAVGGAKSAAERQRKRAAAGDALLSGPSAPGPTARLTPKTLVGA
jgi:hypothetical protein